MTAFRSDTARLPRWLAILLVCMAGLLLEVGYTRIVSYKLWYYYTYLVIGLSLLGIGSGGIFVVVSAPLRRATTQRVLGLCSLWGAVSIAVGYWIMARLPINTVAIWDYGSWRSIENLGRLALMSFVIFATFIALGIIVSTLLGRAGDGVGKLYFADLLGAGLGCLLAVPLIAELGPPSVIILSALIFAVVGVLSLAPRSTVFGFACVVTAVLVVGVVWSDARPEVRTEQGKIRSDTGASLFHDWGPVFRVDVMDEFEPNAPNRLLAHDGTFGSGIWRFDGDLSEQDRFETDVRRIPFDILDQPPGRELIIGSAGGHEILGSLYFGAPNIEAVELNPVTVDIIEHEFAEFTGHLTERPEVHLTQGDGRSYLARTDADYDLVWYVAPDSYAANNAASSGAFVLSESYLYTSQMIEETLEHLTDDGIMVVQFGEVDFRGKPNRTSRYVVTARDALEDIGVPDPSQHLIVGAAVPENAGDLSTIIVKRTPFTPDEVATFSESIARLDDNEPVYAPGETFDGFADHIVARLAGGTDADVRQIVEDNPREIHAISDDAPFFWHFSGFRSVLSDITQPLNVNDPEDVIGERVLLLLLMMAVAYATVFLLLPFVFVRKQWAALPAKGTSAVYFSCLGLGFMFFEITMIQRLVRFLGYPTYSLTVTLASILISTGLGALLSKRLADRSRNLMPALLGALAALTLFYQFALDPITDALLTSGLGVRVAFAFVVLAPLGFCLGMFMPLGLGLVTKMTDHGEEYVAWAWAVNGFFSVIGSVLTTILSMSFGFRAVQYGALAIYAAAVLTFLRLRRTAEAATAPEEPEEEPARLVAAASSPV